MYRIAICDDNEQFLYFCENKLNEYCKSNSFQVYIRCYSDSDMLIEHLEENKNYDAFILDIDMPIFSGIDVAKFIREKSKSAVIIFLSAFDSFAIQGYGLNVSSYILKNEIDNDLDNTLNEMFLQLKRLNIGKVYSISNQRKFIKFLQENIIYIFKNQKNAIFVLEDNQEEWERATLQEVFQRMNNPNMIMVDRGLIINVNHIQSIVGDKIKMDNGQELITSKNQINNLKKYLVTYWGNIL